MIHFTTLPAMQQPATKQQLATICQDVFLWRKEQFGGGAAKPVLLPVEKRFVLGPAAGH